MERLGTYDRLLYSLLVWTGFGTHENNCIKYINIYFYTKSLLNSGNRNGEESWLIQSLNFGGQLWKSIEGSKGVDIGRPIDWEDQ